MSDLPANVRPRASRFLPQFSPAYAAHQKRPPFAQIKRPTTWKEKVVVVKDCAVWWWIALPEQKWVKISECHRARSLLLDELSKVDVPMVVKVVVFKRDRR